MSLLWGKNVRQSFCLNMFISFAVKIELKILILAEGSVMKTTFLKNRYIFYLPVSLFVCLMIYSCSDLAVDDTQIIEKNSAISSVEFQMQAGAGPAYIVEPGSSIQEAVDLAVNGGTIHIKPGVYIEAVTVTQPNIRIMGRKGPGGSVVIENLGGVNNGINVRAGADNFALQM